VDPNVLISAAISAVGAPRELLVAWYTGRFEMIVSYDLLYELEAVLMRPWFRRKLTFSDVVEYVMWIRERATFVPDVPPLEEWLVEPLPDPDDAYLVALTKERGADYPVTGDRGLREAAGWFTTAEPDLRSLAVISPRDFVQQALPSPPEGPRP
jgi:uncharacterized protein